jgi:hypothetical protein
MPHHHPGASATLLAALLLAACAPDTDAAAADTADAPQPAAASTDAAPATQPNPPANAPTTAQGAAPAGYYECYFHGDYGLQNSSMTSMRIHGPAEYEAMGERGRYAEADGRLQMETGPLAGRVSELRESSGKPAIVFIRRDNEVDGRPTIDISDTWCYLEP